MKALLALAFALLAAQAQAETPETIKYEQIRAAAVSQCDLPEKMHSYAAGVLSRFTAQIVLPKLKMLNTAFHVGFSTVSGANVARGACVVVFLGLPNDPVSEKNSNFYKKAKEKGALPLLVFDGFDENDQIRLKPLGEAVN
jgi:hypothetical protein